MDSSIWYNHLRDKQKCPPPVTCALNFVLFYWAAFCRFGFRISFAFSERLEIETHQHPIIINPCSFRLPASSFLHLLKPFCRTSLPITNSQSCLTSSPRLDVLPLNGGEDLNMWRWSGYRFPSFSASSAGELNTFDVNSFNDSLKQPQSHFCRNFERTSLQLHQLQLPSSKWPSHESLSTSASEQKM